MAEHSNQDALLVPAGMECRDGICVFPSPSDPGADSALSSAEQIIPFRARWKYWDKPVPPPAGWQGASFDDSEWPAGTAPLGYGFEEVGTHVSTGVRIRDRWPIYFRHEFNLSQNIGGEYRLALHRLGGTMAFLNGEECCSDNMSPDAPLGWPLSDTANHPLQFPLLPLQLNPGKNVVAVEAHPCSVRMCFDLAVYAGEAAIPRQAVFSPKKELLGAGMIAPELTWYEVGSKQIRSTKDFRGQKLILDFLGTNCGWCWKKIPRLQHWARSLKESKVAVAAISCFGTVADMERIVGDRRHFLSDVMFGAEPLAWDFFSTIAYTQFHIRGTPVLFLIDENGLIRASSYADGGAGYESFLKNADLAGVPLLALQTEIDDIEVKVEDGELVLQQRHGDL